MRRALAATLLLACLPTARADGPADLSKVERKITREPTYQSKAPKYCLLVFGLEARHKAWLVEDGDTLHVDRNGNGDLTEPGEAIKGDKGFNVSDLKIGGLTHTNLRIMKMGASAESVGNDEEWQRLKKANPDNPVMWWVNISAERDLDDPRDLPKKVNYIINGDGAGMLLFGNSPQDAPVIHLNGQFTLGLQDRRQQLLVGEKKMLQIGVGPQGIGPGTFAFVLYPNTIPATMYPEIEVTYPTVSRSQDPIKKKYTLKERC